MSEQASHGNTSKGSSLRSQSPESYISSSSEDDAFATHEHKDKLRKSYHRIRIPPIDPTVLADLEEQAKYTSKSIDKMMGYLTKELGKITDVTMETVNVYDSAIENVQAEVEKNIRSMYGLIAKCEELDRKMKPVTELGKQVHDIREAVDILEQLCK